MAEPVARLIRELPSDERPRERLLANGAGALADSELVAVLLRTGRSGTSAIELGRELLGESGGLQGLLGVRPEALQRRVKARIAEIVQLGLPARGFNQALRIQGEQRRGERLQEPVGDPDRARRIGIGVVECGARRCGHGIVTGRLGLTAPRPTYTSAPPTARPDATGDTTAERRVEISRRATMMLTAHGLLI